jgi:hypothetical protein
MKEKLLAVWAKVSPLLSKLYNASPLLTGILIGYFGKPIIKLALDLAAAAIKQILG